MRWTILLAVAVAVVLAAGLLVRGLAQEHRARDHEHGQHGHEHEQHHDPAADSDDATTHHSFEDVERWAAMFDDPERAAWQKPEAVVAALELEPGMAVADIGAGTGYFNRFLAAAVGPEGTVYAIDTEPGMVAHMKERAEREGTPNVVPVTCEPADPKLADGSVDRILIVNTFHHFDDRRQYFARLARALRPGGRIAIVDFKKEPLPVGPPPEIKLERGQIVDEMEAAGFRLVGEPDFLPHQNYLVFAPR